MSVATSTAIGIAGAVTAGAGIAGSAIASSKQAGATDRATAATENASANTLAFQKDVYGRTLADEQPYMAVGADAAKQLGAGLDDGSLTAAYPGGPFHFTGVDLKNDPAYQFDLQQGTQAIQRSAAASGGLVSGGTLKDLDSFSQGYASNQYQQSYANALAAYQQAYAQFETTQGNKFSRLAGVAGLGQNAVTQTATSGGNAAGVVANTNTNTANTLANLYASQGNAGAAATLSGVNAVTGGVNQAVNYFAQRTGSSYGGRPGGGGIYDSKGNYIGE